MCYISEGISAAAPKWLIFVGLFLNALIVRWIFLPHKSIDALAQQGESVIWTVAWDTVGSCTSVSILVLISNSQHHIVPIFSLRKTSG